MGVRVNPPMHTRSALGLLGGAALGLAVAAGVIACSDDGGAPGRDGGGAAPDGSGGAVDAGGPRPDTGAAAPDAAAG